MARTSGGEELAAPGDRWHAAAAWVQARTSFWPDYGPRPPAGGPADAPEAAGETPSPADYPAVSAGTSIAGIVGGAIVLVLAGLVGLGLRLLGRPEQASS